MRSLCIYYTLRCLEYIFSVSSPLRRNGLLIVKTLIHVRLLVHVYAAYVYSG